MVSKVFADIKTFYSTPEKFTQEDPQKAIIYSTALKILSTLAICFGIIFSNYYFIAPTILVLGASLYIDYKVIKTIPYYLNQQKKKFQAMLIDEALKMENHIKENLDVYIQKSTQIIADSKIDHSAYAMIDKVINDDPEYKGYQEGKMARRFLGGLFFERPKGFIKGFFGY